MRYGHGRKNMELNAVNFLQYDEKQRLHSVGACPEA